MEKLALQNGALVKQPLGANKEVFKKLVEEIIIWPVWPFKAWMKELVTHQATGAFLLNSSIAQGRIELAARISSDCYGLIEERDG